jgi:hypothetical protein
MATITMSPSKITLLRAQGVEKLNSVRQKNADMRATMGLEGNKIIKLKPLSDETKAKIEAFHASGRFGSK